MKGPRTNNNSSLFDSTRCVPEARVAPDDAAIASASTPATEAATTRRGLGRRMDTASLSLGEEPHPQPRRAEVRLQAHCMSNAWFGTWLDSLSCRQSLRRTPTDMPTAHPGRRRGDCLVPRETLNTRLERDRGSVEGAALTGPPRPGQPYQPYAPQVSDARACRPRLCARRCQRLVLREWASRCRARALRLRSTWMARLASPIHAVQ
jgi:hypothetical protein